MNAYPSLSLQHRRQNLTALAAFDELTIKLESNHTDIEPSFRRSWIRLIILDLAAQASGRSDWDSQTIHRALVCLKLLGRSQIATDDLASHLPLFTRYANLLPLLSPQSDEPSSSNTLTPPIPFDHNLVEESLRILANTLFLHPLARASPHLSPAINSLVDLAVNHNDLSSPQAASSHHFLASRILFLITAVPSALIIEIIQHTSLIPELADALKREMQSRSSASSLSDQQPTSHLRAVPAEVLTEYLKLIFNLMVQYPRALREFPPTPTPHLSNSPFLASNISHFNPTSLPNASDHKPSKSPAASNPIPLHGSPDAGTRRPSIKQRFVNQINMKKLSRKPKGPSKPHQHSDSSSSSPLVLSRPLVTSAALDQRSEISSLASGSPRVSFSPEDDALAIWTDPENKVFACLLPYLIQLFLYEPLPEPPNLKAPLSSYIHTLLNFPACPSFYFNHYKLTDHSCPDKGIPPLLNKLITILDQVTEFYCPLNPDEPAVKQRCVEHDMDLDVNLTQVLVLLVNLLSPAKLSPGCGLTDDIRSLIQARIVPPTLDRSVGLNKQSNLIGRLLRLMNCIGYNSLRVTCGGFLYAVYNEDADHLVSQVGYGPLAGYLMSIGAPSVNPSSQHQPPSNVNPITGAYYPPESEQPTAKTMTEEQEEAEADRLCDLFDRMNRNGLIKVEDPRRKAVETGRIEVIEETLNKEIEAQEAAEEQSALDEMKRYKDRMKPKTGDDA